MTRKAMVVLSGGQDSTTCLYWAVNKYGKDNVHAVTFDYAQRHAREIQAARDVARLAGVDARHEIVHLGPVLAGTSPLTNPQEVLEQYQDHDSMAATIGERVELTFVPGRNALFLVLAANRAFVAGCTTLVTGVCEADNANYPDCRNTFIQDMAQALQTAFGLDREGKEFEIRTPLMYLSKAQSISLARNLDGCMGALAFSHTAYDGQFPPTGHDHATILRAHGFEEAGVPDPLWLRANLLGLAALPATPNYAPSPILDRVATEVVEAMTRMSPVEVTE